MRISRHIGMFRIDRRIVLALVLLGLAVTARSWLAAHPEHDPWAPLDLDDPRGWATEAKLRALRSDPATCRAVLQRSDIAFTVLPPEGEDACRREDRTRLSDFPLSPDTPPVTCATAVSLVLWEKDVVRTAAREALGKSVDRIEHFGAYSCRRMYGRDEGRWSEHATANAIDIAGFVTSDGERISVLRDWEGETPEARFLRRVRDGACASFATVLSPDYNAAHADHLHFDMSEGWSGVCR